jgi:ribosomal protein L7Ae-like RNA K-turn-binding protein
LSDKFFQFLSLAKKAGNLIEGYNKCEELIKKDQIKLIIFSEDAAQNTINKFTTYCARYEVPIIKSSSKEILGAALGRQEIKIIGVIDEKMSIKLLELHDEMLKK